MSFRPPRHNFCPETQQELLEFLKVADAKKRLPQKPNVWNKILPSNPAWSERNKDVVIVIDDDDDSEGDSSEIDAATIEEILNTQLDLRQADTSTVKDVAFAVKETLEMQDYLPESVLEDLAICDDFEQLFGLLLQSLSSGEIANLGACLVQNSEEVVLHYLRCLLLVKLGDDFCDELKASLLEYSELHAGMLKDEILMKLTNGAVTKTFVQYLTGLNLEFQADILRKFVLSTDKMDLDHVELVQSLLNKHVEVEVLNKLVQIMDGIADQCGNDKVYGKLLLSIVQFLGGNVVHVEQALKHAIARHRSVWKTKLQKTFDSLLQAGLLMSQTQQF